ncbi:PRELI domain-containing protein 1, mitochondrial [Cricetulus griseus]|uniref:PRELI domain-containing protein 1 n=1 Tax=Cricetulus griseus TaxID=10029 RepID=G3IKZ6_CRIGR|nr:PRELI domain-containing protein 1, mitochondrial [Cricetulus griseus]ERE82117.1 PRELI domain-containing protein 1 [Cricetulus griseus]
MPCWAERLFPANLAHSVYILEESIVDPQNQTVTTFTWNINHARLMVVEERCVYCVNSDNRSWTEIVGKPGSPLAYLASLELSRNLVLPGSKAM